MVVWDLSTTVVTTSATKTLVVAPTIGAIAPPLNTLPATAPVPAAVATIAAFFVAVHPVKRRPTRR